MQKTSHGLRCLPQTTIFLLTQMYDGLPQPLRESGVEPQDGTENILGVTTQEFSDPTEAVFAHFGQCNKKQPRAR